MVTKPGWKAFETLEQELKFHETMIFCDITVESVYFYATFEAGKRIKKTRGFSLFQKYSCKSHLVQSSDNIQSPFNKDKKILCQQKRIVFNVLDVCIKFTGCSDLSWKKFMETISLSHFHFKMLNDFPSTVKIWKLYIINDWSHILHEKKGLCRTSLSLVKFTTP